MIDLDKILGEKQENLTKWLMSIKDGHPICQAYYVGGTLCIDVVVGELFTMLGEMRPLKGAYSLIMINLDETVGWLMLGNDKKILNTKNCILIFEIYLQAKGPTDYFKENLAKSHVRHLKDFINKRYVFSKG